MTCQQAARQQTLCCRGKALAKLKPRAELHDLRTATPIQCSRALCTARGAQAAGYVPDAENIPDEQTGTAEHELLVAEQHAALREAFTRLPPCCQRLIASLIEDPPVPYAQISRRLGIPVESIGPIRGRCLEKLRRDPSVAA